MLFVIRASADQGQGPGPGQSPDLLYGVGAGVKIITRTNKRQQVGPAARLAVMVWVWGRVGRLLLLDVILAITMG